jgi:hypothetical protein
MKEIDKSFLSSCQEILVVHENRHNDIQNVFLNIKQWAIECLSDVLYSYTADGLLKALRTHFQIFSQDILPRIIELGLTLEDDPILCLRYMGIYHLAREKRSVMIQSIDKQNKDHWIHANTAINEYKSIISALLSVRDTLPEKNLINAIEESLQNIDLHGNALDKIRNILSTVIEIKLTLFLIDGKCRECVRERIANMLCSIGKSVPSIHCQHANQCKHSHLLALVYTQSS